MNENNVNNMNNENNENNENYANSCLDKKRWIKINNEMITYTPKHTDIIRCGKCKSYAFLYFVHDMIGDYYGPKKHIDCSGNYVYVCTNNRKHINHTEEM